MNAIAPNDFVAIPIPTELYQAIAQRFPDRVSTIIENVTWDYLERTKEDIAAKTSGVFWEALFLPSGTELRVRHFGRYKMGRVDGESFVYDGESYPSISKMANAMRGHNVNAWKVVEIKRPTDSTWILALRLRRG